MHHYTESGLSNVWLENGYSLHKTPYGKGVSIDDAHGLHSALAMEITAKKGRITGKELRFLRTLLGLSQGNLAEKCLGVSEQSVSLWERTGKVPAQVDAIVRLLALEKLKGNARITDVLHRINDVDRLMNQRIVAVERRKKWTARVEEKGKTAAAI
jgi:DNA-binding transcriptional regulator YiaG